MASLPVRRPAAAISGPAPAVTTCPGCALREPLALGRLLRASSCLESRRRLSLPGLPRQDRLALPWAVVATAWQLNRRA